MNRAASLLLVAALLLTAGCSSEPDAGAKPARLRVEMSSILDIGDIPRLMALDAMRAQGYTVDTVTLDDTAMTILALQRGDVDLAVASDVTGWAAIEKGAPIVALIDDTVNPTVLAVRDGVAHCAELQGKRVAVPNLTGGKTLLLHRYIERHCPGTVPSLLVIGGEHTRVAGLLQSELDAAVVDLAVLEALEDTQPGALSAQVVFADEFPGLMAMSLFVRRELTAKYPAAVTDWLRALLDARRRIQDPRVLADAFVTRLGMPPARAEKSAATYLARHFWDVNGRYTPEIVQRNVDFAIAAAGVKPGLKASDVADLTFLNTVLDQIGRK